MKAYHSAVVGDSGGGKTTLLRQMHDEFLGLSIWVNHNNTPGVAGARASTLRAMQEADRPRINLSCDGVNEGGELARTFAHEYHDRTGYPTQIIGDEIHEHGLPDGTEIPQTPWKSMLHEDRDKALKVVVATQDPSDLHYTPIKQCRWYVWVGEWSTFHEGFIRYFGIDKADLPTEPYRYVVLNKRMDVVARGTTNAGYA